MIVFRTDPAVGLVCEPLDSGTGWTWTWASRLGALLREAESRFGPRDRAYTPLGVEFGGDIPTIWFPENCGNVAIKLSESARLDPRQAFFQLAHEVVHLLSPEGAATAPVIEEGLATLFAHDRCAELGIAIAAAEPSYLEAEQATRRLLALDERAIRIAREREARFTRFTPELLLEAAPGLAERDALYLCRPFVR